MVSSRNCRLFFQQSPRNCRKGLFSIKGFSASQWFYSKFFDRYLICQPSGTELGFRPLLITRVRTGWDMNHVKYKKAIASRSLTRNRLLYVKIPDILQYKRSVWYLSSRQRNIGWVFRIWMKIFKKCRVIGPRSPPSHISMIFIDKILSNYPVQSPLPPVGRYLKFSTFYPTRARLLYTWLQRLHHMAWEFESIIAAVINLTYSLPKDINTHNMRMKCQRSQRSAGIWSCTILRSLKCSVKQARDWRDCVQNNTNKCAASYVPWPTSIACWDCTCWESRAMDASNVTMSLNPRVLLSPCCSSIAIRLSDQGFYLELMLV